MKKWLIAICMTLCLLSLTACGAKEKDNLYSDEAATVEACYYAGMVDYFVENAYVDRITDSMYENACNNMESAMKDMGKLDSSIVNAAVNIETAMQYAEQSGVPLSMDYFVEYVPESVTFISNTVETDKVGQPYNGNIVIGIKGEKKDAKFEVVYERGEIKSLTTNVNYTFAEMMSKAGLNTLLGMGTVFTVLILISLIISAFNLIPKVQGLFTKKPEKETVTAKSVDQAIAQIVEKEELSDDLELVAVISAAIAAYESTSTDGFVVRSIRRAR